MSRRRPSTADALVLLPWWFSAILAGVAFFGGAAIQAILPPDARGFAPTIGMLRIAFSILLLLLALKSFLRSFTTNRNLETQSGIDSLKQLHWKEFENLLGEVFRREGYAVEERLGGGPDGGVDLVLRQDVRKSLVQCKLRTCASVGLPVVRELYGAMAAEGAASGILVTTSVFTGEVHRFATDKPIRLIDGPALLELVRSVQSSLRRHASSEEPAQPDSPPSCPACGGRMVLRTAGKGPNAGSRFWGCSGFPRCRKIINL
jgi:restriction system protein